VKTENDKHELSRCESDSPGTNFANHMGNESIIYQKLLSES